MVNKMNFQQNFQIIKRNGQGGILNRQSLKKINFQKTEMSRVASILWHPLQEIQKKMLVVLLQYASVTARKLRNQKH